MRARQLTLALLLPASLTIACNDSTGDGTPTGSSTGSRQDGARETSFAAAAKEELPGLGHKFRLLFAMMDDQDPDNPTNDVISLLATPATRGVARRELPPGIKIAALDHQLNLKYFFPARTCQNGGPRIDLAIDRNGDGNFDGNAFGYVGHASF